MLSLLCLLAACAVRMAGNPQASTVVAFAELDYAAELDANTPEGLAKLSSQLYQGMMNGEISPKEGFERLLGMTPGESFDAMRAQEAEFSAQIDVSRALFENEGNRIEGYDFSKTYYGDGEPGLCSIYRIQNMSDGNMYFFRQDFVLQSDGSWRIRGDNLVNDFVMRD